MSPWLHLFCKYMSSLAPSSFTRNDVASFRLIASNTPLTLDEMNSIQTPSRLIDRHMSVDDGESYQPFVDQEQVMVMFRLNGCFYGRIETGVSKIHIENVQADTACQPDI